MLHVIYSLSGVKQQVSEEHQVLSIPVSLRKSHLSHTVSWTCTQITESENSLRFADTDWDNKLYNKPFYVPKISLLILPICQIEKMAVL